jgi:hypothetical protein
MPGIHESEEARNGILYARGPGVRPGTATVPIEDIDLLPTILAAVGLPQAEDLPGAVAPFLNVSRPAAVSSYRDTPVERVATPASQVDGAILEKLRTLGYIE